MPPPPVLLRKHWNSINPLKDNHSPDNGFFHLPSCRVRSALMYIFQLRPWFKASRLKTLFSLGGYFPFKPLPQAQKNLNARRIEKSFIMIKISRANLTLNTTNDPPPHPPCLPRKRGPSSGLPSRRRAFRLSRAGNRPSRRLQRRPDSHAGHAWP